MSKNQQSWPSTSGGAEGQEPIWVVVRSTVHRRGLPRNRVATVDITDPVIRHELQASWIVPLPAAEQPGGAFNLRSGTMAADITHQVNLSGEWRDAFVSEEEDENNKTFQVIIDGGTLEPHSCSRGAASGQFRDKE